MRKHVLMAGFASAVLLLPSIAMAGSIGGVQGAGSGGGGAGANGETQFRAKNAAGADVVVTMNAHTGAVVGERAAE